jgi:hypothetical protein
MKARTGPSESHAAVRDALERARATGENETVVFHLRGADISKPPTPAETEHMAEGLIKKAVSHCGHEPQQKTVFQNLGSMAVQGDADLLLKILEQPEVHAASLNRPEGGQIELIRPVRKSAAKNKGWVDVS